MRYALRHWRFYLLVTVTLAFGVGISTAMVGLLDMFFLRGPAHVRSPEQLWNIPGVTDFQTYVVFSQSATTLDIAAYRRQRVNLGLGPDAYEVIAECVTSNFFDVLGVENPIGSLHSAMRFVDTKAAVVIAEAIWLSRFGGDRNVIGQHILLSGQPFEIVGIAPRGFGGLQIEPPDLWVPLIPASALCTSHGSLHAGGASLNLVGRLRPNVTRAQAEAEVASVQMGSQQSGNGPGIPGPVLQSIYDARLPLVRPDARVAALGAVGAILVLLIACTNATGLFVLRVIDRRQEIAIRRQLGASANRLLLQALSEQSFVLIGCPILGVLIAFWMNSLIRAFLPFADWHVAVNLKMLLFEVAIGIGAGLASSVAPVLLGARQSIRATLSSGVARLTKASRASSVVLVVQSALAFALITAAGLMARSVANLWSDLGYDLDKIISITVNTRQMGYRSDEETRRFFETLEERSRRVPGVERTTLTSGDLLGALRDHLIVYVRGNWENSMPGIGALHAVSPEYFGTVGTRIIAGRTFTSDDTLSAEPVMIVSDSLAKQLYSERSAVGQCAFFLGRQECVRVVGVSESRRHQRLTEQRAEIFIPLAQGAHYTFSYVLPRSLLVRAAEAPSVVAARLAAALSSTARDGPAFAIQPLEDLAVTQGRSFRLSALIFAIFGLVALAMGGVGLYAALSFSVRRRTREIGLRVALGASRKNVIRHTCLGAVGVVAAGLCVGILIVVASAGMLRSFLFGVDPFDLPTVLSAIFSLVAAAGLGALAPAIRAATVNPVVALREE
jgi:putative ABC transport system permease protein